MWRQVYGSCSRLTGSGRNLPLQHEAAVLASEEPISCQKEAVEKTIHCKALAGRATLAVVSQLLTMLPLREFPGGLDGLREERDTAAEFTHLAERRRLVGGFGLFLLQ
jgi:hypothetical protein